MEVARGLRSIRGSSSITTYATSSNTSRQSVSTWNYTKIVAHRQPHNSRSANTLLPHGKPHSFSSGSKKCHASNTSSSSSQPSSLPKTNILEQPDKFRPPSHPARLNTRRRPSPLGGGSYNQGMTEVEREASKNKRYPHMFPNEGSTMHWFLTNRWVHIWITLGTLTTLAVVSLTQSFAHTSPFAHLLPTFSTFLRHPITSTREFMSVLRLHMEYRTSETAARRRQNILDAQKRRLYRRAHGMEDLDRNEDQGIDVRGLVSWDDGLTNPERERLRVAREKGEDVVLRPGDNVTTGREVLEMGGDVDEAVGEFVRRKREEESLLSQDQGEQQAVVQERRKPKRWLGIW